MYDVQLYSVHCTVYNGHCTVNNANTNTNITHLNERIYFIAKKYFLPLHVFNVFKRVYFTYPTLDVFRVT